MQQSTQPIKQSLWQALKDLDFLSSFFSWFFMLLTRLSEPLMLLSTLYIVAETGVPAIAMPALHNLAIGIMITAPEVILPGSFVVAARAQKHARLLFAVCWTFVLLTLITLISLFVWHFTGQALAWLMCARCAAAVGYSILMRVMSHTHDQVQVVSVPDVTERFTEHLQRIETKFDRRIVETEQHMTERFTELLQSLERTITEQIERTSTGHQDLPVLAELVTLPAQLECQVQASQAEMRAMLQEVKATMEASTARPRLALVESLPKGGVNTSENGIDKAAFVRQCFTEHPEMRNADIQRKASEQGVNISPAYISELRKAFTEEQSA